MQDLILHPFEEEVTLISDEQHSWKVTKKKGSATGVGVSVSGAGAYAELEGSFTFTMKRMESSSTYQKMVKEHNISGGVQGFWGWIGIKTNASTHKKEIQSAFQELSDSQEIKGTVNVKLMVTGLYPNVQVDASAYIFLLQITDAQGNSINVFSDGSPKDDVGSQDQNKNNLPTKDNNSTIEI